MKKVIVLMLLALIIVASSGCVENQIPELNVNKKEKVETADVLLIKDVKIVPEAPIFPDTTVELIITIQNIDDKKSIPYKVELFNPSIFTIEKSSGTSGELLPQGEKVIDFVLKVPKEKVKITPTVNFRILYNFSTSTTYDVVVVNMAQIKQAQLAGKPVSFDIEKSIGSGPIKVDISLKGSSYLIAGQKGVLSIVVQNKGSGFLKEGKIKKNKLKLTLINKGINDIESTTKKFEIIKSGSTFSYGYNKDDIEMMERSTSPILLKITAPSVDLYKTYTFLANVSYTYEIRGSKEIPITPLEIE
ncbi:MAG: hypothetical protein J7L43_03085 [Candidatus Aenigmarchaeota archaeon]|nr:hypothetical protein [Candidatus Aenigmarchaeota archaeon]